MTLSLETTIEDIQHNTKLTVRITHLGFGLDFQQGEEGVLIILDEERASGVQRFVSKGFEFLTTRRECTVEVADSLVASVQSFLKLKLEQKSIVLTLSRGLREISVHISDADLINIFDALNLYFSNLIE